MTVAYLVGAIPFGLLLARWIAGVDIREAGSGNIGATNVARSIGRGWGGLTLVLDASKGAAPVWGALSILGLPLGWAVGVGSAAILGHVFPCYLGFRGGKGVATAAGVFMALTPIPTAMALLGFVLGIAMTRVVGGGSMLGVVVLVVATAVFDRRPAVVGLAGMTALLILVRHAGNVRRFFRSKDPENGHEKG